MVIVNVLFQECYFWLCLEISSFGPAGKAFIFVLTVKLWFCCPKRIINWFYVLLSHFSSRVLNIVQPRKFVLTLVTNAEVTPVPKILTLILLCTLGSGVDPKIWFGFPDLLFRGFVCPPLSLPHVRTVAHAYASWPTWRYKLEVSNYHNPQVTNLDTCSHKNN